MDEFTLDTALKPLAVKSCHQAFNLFPHILLSCEAHHK